ncbi:cupin domain-containing protein [Halovivax sp.]|uniref:cupin domain-containing protein n=1 Tax=Halovivax sp. TaxID=1935978 RepID=UPI0025C5BDCF|nr:cupin domain-containing protein [Halovivax sp.]
MEKVRVEDLENRMGPADVKRPLSRALGTEHVAVNYYELDPGESFAFGYHSHEAQEELFVVREGTVTFETAEGDVAVGAGEAIRFEPGESQRGVNAGDERVVALAIGAPKDPGELSLLRECVQCGTRTPASVSLTEDRKAIVTTCLECGMETGRYTE